MRVLAALAQAAIALAVAAACAPPPQGATPLGLPTNTLDSGPTTDADGADGDRGVDAATDAGQGAVVDTAGAGADAGDSAGGLDAGPLDGAALYGKLCSYCHGPKGAGGLQAPRLDRWHLPRSQLVARIAGTMPPQNPASCDATCAEAIVQWLEADIWPACALPPRRLRQLSRREWARTVADLLPGLGGGACAGLADCSATSQSCAASVCVDDACGLHTFTLADATNAYGKVHVASAANGWAPTVAAGGWAMAWDAGLKSWVVKVPMNPGSWAYKFVVDDKTWLSDAANPNKIGDGFGGDNSVVTISCAAGSAGAAGALVAAMAADFPPDARPSHYAFDQHAAAGMVNALHVEQQLEAGRVLANAAAAKVAAAWGCLPGAAASACSQKLVEEFGLRALRRPLSGAEVGRYKGLVEAQPDAVAGARALIRALLASPHHWYRSELGVATGQGEYALGPYEVASQLSYTLTGTMPDKALFAAAASGALATTTGLLAEADRLLASASARAHLGDFALMWLGAERVRDEPKSPTLFPAFDDALRRALVAEVAAFYADLVLDSGGKVGDLMTASTQWVDASLAAHYGLPAPSGGGKGLQQVKGDGKRAGVLGLGAVLSATAHSDQTSPSRRGLFVRTRLLCHELPPPPPDAGGVPEIDPGATTKERFAQHTADPVCASCHKVIDPVGFGFEAFDAVGRWRQLDNGKPVDASGDMVDVEAIGAGTSAPFADLPTLGKSLATSAAARECHGRWWWRFALGQGEGVADRCELKALAQQVEGDGGDLGALLRRVVALPSFRLRAPTSPASAP